MTPRCLIQEIRTVYLSLYQSKNTVEDCFKQMHDPTSIRN